MISNRKLSLIGLLIGLALVIVFMQGKLEPARAETTGSNSDYSILLPIIRANYPLPMSIFGVEINQGWVAPTLDKAVDARITAARYNGIRWHEVEAVRGVINWSVLSGFEAEMIALNEAGISPMVIVRGTPTWARIPNSQYADYSCGAIAPSALPDFANFLTAIVERYSRPPFNIQYWELGNEPDVDPTYVTTNSPYGCWGDDDDLYYGASRYTQMLSVAYPAIKAANPSATVILGGLLLDCDPTNPPAHYSCRSGNFLEGILMNGGGQYLDWITYHSYPYWYGAQDLDWDLDYSKWSLRGGLLLGKLDFIREVMARYGVQKPIMMNEGGLVCGYRSDDPRYVNCQTEAFNHLQANYLIRMFTRSWAANLAGATWYTLNGPGWRECGLLEGNTTPRRSYDALYFLANRLQSARYQQQLASGTLEGYQFVDLARSGQRYQIYWTNSATSFEIDLPANTTAIYDRYGGTLPISGDKFQVGFDPVVIVFGP